MICSGISARGRPCRVGCFVWNCNLLVSGLSTWKRGWHLTHMFSWKRIFTAFWLAVSQTFNQSHIAWFKPAKSKSFSLTNKTQVTEKAREEFLIENQDLLSNNLKVYCTDLNVSFITQWLRRAPDLYLRYSITNPRSEMTGIRPRFLDFFIPYES